MIKELERQLEENTQAINKEKNLYSFHKLADQRILILKAIRDHEH